MVAKFEQSRVKELLDAELARNGPKPMSAFMLLYTTMAPELSPEGRNHFGPVWMEAVAIASGMPFEDAARDMTLIAKALHDDLHSAQ